MGNTIKLVATGSFAAIFIYLIVSHGTTAVALFNSGFSGITNYTKALQGR